jgi:hypothetical protein
LNCEAPDDAREPKSERRREGWSSGFSLLRRRKQAKAWTPTDGASAAAEDCKLQIANFKSRIDEGAIGAGSAGSAILHAARIAPAALRRTSHLQFAFFNLQFAIIFQAKA